MSPTSMSPTDHNRFAGRWLSTPLAGLEITVANRPVFPAIRHACHAIAIAGHSRTVSVKPSQAGRHDSVEQPAGQPIGQHRATLA